MKFGGGSMGALNIWTQNALKEQVAKREEDRQIDARIKAAQLQAQLEMDLNEKKYQFDKEHGLLEKPRDPIADYRAKLEIEKEFNPPQPVGQPIIEDIGGGLYKITDSVTGKYEIRTKPKAGRGGGSGGGSSYGGTGTINGKIKPRPGYEWATTINAKGGITRREVPIAAQKGALTEEKAFAMWERRRSDAVAAGEDPAKAWKRMPQKARDLINAANNPNAGAGTEARQPAPGVNAEQAKAIVSNARSNGMSRPQFVALVAQSVKEGKSTPEEARLVLSMWPEMKATDPRKLNLNTPAGMTYRVGAEDYVPKQGNQFGKKTKTQKKKTPAIVYSPPARTSQWGSK